MCASLCDCTSLCKSAPLYECTLLCECKCVVIVNVCNSSLATICNSNNYLQVCVLHIVVKKVATICTCRKDCLCAYLHAVARFQCSITLQKDPMLHHSAKRWKTVYAVISVVLLRRISMFGLYIRFTVCCCMIRSKVNYGPNRTSMVNRILPFCRKNRGPGFKSRSELCFLLFHPKCFVCISFYTERLSYTSEVCK